MFNAQSSLSNALPALVKRDRIVLFLQRRLWDHCILNGTFVVAETISWSQNRDSKHAKFVLQSIIHLSCDLERNEF